MSSRFPARGSGAALWIVVGVFAVVNLVIAWWFGIRTGQDTGIYIDGAAAMLEGHALTARQPSYAGYIAVVALCQWLGVGPSGVIAIQLFAAATAAAVVFLLASSLGGTTAGAVAVLMLAADLETNRWHVYLLTDSLFASMLLLATWLVYRAAVAGVIWRYALAAVAMIAAALIRPEGWFVLPAAAAYWIVSAPLAPGVRAASMAAIILMFAALATLVTPRLGGNLEAVGPAHMLRQGQTIWDYDGWRLSMPSGPPPVPDAGSAVNAIAYAISHPISTAQLMVARVAVHFAHVRPFFSYAHNVVIAAWLVPVYLCAVRGALVTRARSLKMWCAGVIGTQTLMVALTHADWDGRYLAHVMQLIYPFAAVGLVDVVGRFRGRGAGAVIA